MSVNRDKLRADMVFRHGLCELTDEQIDVLEKTHYYGIDVIEAASEIIKQIRSMYGSKIYTDEYLEFKKWFDGGMIGDCPISEGRFKEIYEKI